MTKQEAIHLIEDTFNKKFDEERFLRFAKNLLNDTADRENVYRGNYIKDAYKEHISQYKRIGKYTDPNGDEIDILTVEVHDHSKLDKARTALRNFVIAHLDNFEKDYALVAFYARSDEGADWRFSFVKLEYRTEVKEGKLKQRKELTPAKRYSFLVGEHEKAHTAKAQLLPYLQNVYNNPTVAELEQAFSIETVTDEFFEQYKLLFGKLVEQFEKDTVLKAELAKNNVEISRFAKKLLGQIVFLYFLQKKGWMGVDKAANWGSGKKNFLQTLYTEATQNNKNYFADYLQYLFYEALAKEHNNEGVNGYYTKLRSRIPFLNGGLFEADYDWQNANISIPNELFRNDEKLKTGDIGTGILDVFDRYNFTIKEDEPLEKEVAVDPEMLGKVFENMLEVTERKSKGAFYTPREIVHYMCQESLIHYLDNAINDTDAKVVKTELEEFIRHGFFALENDQRVIREGKETRTYQFQLPESIRHNADKLDHCLSHIKICDPAIGSGAFPVGLLHELVNAQLVLRQYLSTNYFKAKLKALGLSQQEYEQSPSKYIYRLKRHTIQESIYGVDIDASAIDVARLRLWLSMVVDEDDLDSIEALPNLDYKIVCGNSLIGLPETAMRDLKIEAEIESLKNKFFAVTDETHKKELRQEINNKIRQLLDSAELFAGYKIDFDFKLYFSEVWREKGGFDIVIGNPPYVFTRGQEFDLSFKNYFNDLLKTKGIIRNNKGLNIQSGKINLFAFFILISNNLLNRRIGSYCYIIPNNLLRATSYDIIREFMLKNTHIESIVDLGKAVFKNVTASTVILHSSLKTLKDKSLIINNVKSLSRKNYDSFYINQESFRKNVSFTINIYVENDSTNLIDIIQSNSVNLGTLCKYISPGIDGDKNKYVFTEKLTTNHKKLLFGKDFKPYKIEYKNWYILYDRKILNRAREEEIFLSKKIIIQRISGGLSPINATLDKNQYYTFNSVNNIILHNEDSISYQYILAILNSDVINWYYAIKFSNRSELTVNISKTYLEIIPIKIDVGFNLPLLTFVDYLLSINEFLLPNKLISLFVKNLIEALVFELYFPTEIKAAGKDILKHLTDLEPIEDSMREEQKLAIIQRTFERLYDPSHPVRNAVETLDSVEEVRIIKEALKK